MDKFHEHLSSQQDRLDADLPNGNVWERIEMTLSKRKAAGSAGPIFRYLAAASVVILIAAGFWTMNRKSVHIKENGTPPGTLAHEKDSIDTAVANNKPVVFSRTVETTAEKEHTKPAPQQPFKKLSAGYAALVSSRLQQLRATPVYAECTEYFSDLTGQLKQMDKDELTIRQDLEHYGPQDALIEQLIQVYERKLKLLKELQTQITRMNKKAGSRADGLKRSEPCFINL